ncbi:hypothetical protein B484DRAFT_54599 [Ochromonadaceae sp. CCMP2298]|nr:hypothetical protein B484DRAFT_54599 [Ochromonadaceae sp. CCMP2298]
MWGVRFAEGWENVRMEPHYTNQKTHIHPHTESIPTNTDNTDVDIHKWPGSPKVARNISYNDVMTPEEEEHGQREDADYVGNADRDHSSGSPRVDGNGGGGESPVLDLDDTYHPPVYTSSPSTLDTQSPSRPGSNNSHMHSRNSRSDSHHSHHSHYSHPAVWGKYPMEADLLGEYHLPLDPPKHTHGSQGSQNLRVHILPLELSLLLRPVCKKILCAVGGLLMFLDALQPHRIVAGRGGGGGGGMEAGVGVGLGTATKAMKATLNEVNKYEMQQAILGAARGPELSMMGGTGMGSVVGMPHSVAHSMPHLPPTRMDLSQSTVVLLRGHYVEVVLVSSGQTLTTLPTAYLREAIQAAPQPQGPQGPQPPVPRMMGSHSLSSLPQNSPNSHSNSVSSLHSLPGNLHSPKPGKGMGTSSKVALVRTMALAVREQECLEGAPTCVHFCPLTHLVLVGFSMGGVGVLALSGAVHSALPRTSHAHITSHSEHGTDITKLITFAHKLQFRRHAEQGPAPIKDTVVALVGDANGVLSLWQIFPTGRKGPSLLSTQSHPGRIEYMHCCVMSEALSHRMVVTACSQGVVKAWKLEAHGMLTIVSFFHADAGKLTCALALPALDTPQEDVDDDVSEMTSPSVGFYSKKGGGGGEGGGSGGNEGGGRGRQDIYCILGFSTGVVECWLLSSAKSRSASRPVARLQDANSAVVSILSPPPFSPTSSVSLRNPSESLFCPLDAQAALMVALANGCCSLLRLNHAGAFQRAGYFTMPAPLSSAIVLQKFPVGKGIGIGGGMGMGGDMAMGGAGGIGGGMAMGGAGSTGKGMGMSMDMPPAAAAAIAAARAAVEASHVRAPAWTGETEEMGAMGEMETHHAQHDTASLEGGGVGAVSGHRSGHKEIYNLEVLVVGEFRVYHILPQCASHIPPQWQRNAQNSQIRQWMEENPPEGSRYLRLPLSPPSSPPSSSASRLSSPSLDSALTPQPSRVTATTPPITLGSPPVRIPSAFASPRQSAITSTRYRDGAGEGDGSRVGSGKEGGVRVDWYGEGEGERDVDENWLSLDQREARAGEWADAWAEARAKAERDEEREKEREEEEEYVASAARKYEMYKEQQEAERQELAQAQAAQAAQEQTQEQVQEQGREQGQGDTPKRRGRVSLHHAKRDTRLLQLFTNNNDQGSVSPAEAVGIVSAYLGDRIVTEEMWQLMGMLHIQPQDRLSFLDVEEITAVATAALASATRSPKKYAQLRAFTDKVTYNSMGEKSVERVRFSKPTLGVAGGFKAAIRAIWDTQPARVLTQKASGHRAEGVPAVLKELPTVYGSLLATRGLVMPEVWGAHLTHWFHPLRVMRIARTLLDICSAKQHEIFLLGEGTGVGGSRGTGVVTETVGGTSPGKPTSASGVTASSAVATLPEILVCYFERNYGEAGEGLMGVARQKVSHFLEACCQYQQHPVVNLVHRMLLGGVQGVVGQSTGLMGMGTGKGQADMRIPPRALETATWLTVEARSLLLSRGCVVSGDLVAVGIGEGHVRAGARAVRWQYVPRADVQQVVDELLRARGRFGPAMYEKVQAAVGGIAAVESFVSADGLVHSTYKSNALIDLERFLETLFFEYLSSFHTLRDLEASLFGEQAMSTAITARPRDISNHAQHPAMDDVDASFGLYHFRNLVKIRALLLEYIQHDPQRTGCIPQETFLGSVQQRAKAGFWGRGNTPADVTNLVGMLSERCTLEDGSLSYIDVMALLAGWEWQMQGDKAFLLKELVAYLPGMHRTVEHSFAASLLRYFAAAPCEPEADPIWTMGLRQGRGGLGQRQGPGGVAGLGDSRWRTEVRPAEDGPGLLTVEREPIRDVPLPTPLKAQEALRRIGQGGGQEGVPRPEVRATLRLRENCIGEIVRTMGRREVNPCFITQQSISTECLPASPVLEKISYSRSIQAMEEIPFTPAPFTPYTSHTRTPLTAPALKLSAPMRPPLPLSLPHVPLPFPSRPSTGNSSVISVSDGGSAVGNGDRGGVGGGSRVASPGLGLDSPPGRVPSPTAHLLLAIPPKNPDEIRSTVSPKLEKVEKDVSFCVEVAGGMGVDGVAGGGLGAGGVVTAELAEAQLDLDALFSHTQKQEHEESGKGNIDESGGWNKRKSGGKNKVEMLKGNIGGNGGESGGSSGGESPGGGGAGFQKHRGRSADNSGDSTPSSPFTPNSAFGDHTGDEYGFSHRSPGSAGGVRLMKGGSWMDRATEDFNSERYSARDWSEKSDRSDNSTYSSRLAGYDLANFDPEKTTSLLYLAVEEVERMKRKYEERKRELETLQETEARGFEQRQIEKEALRRAIAREMRAKERQSMAYFHAQQDIKSKRRDKVRRKMEQIQEEEGADKTAKDEEIAKLAADNLARALQRGRDKSAAAERAVEAQRKGKEGELMMLEEKASRRMEDAMKAVERKREKEREKQEAQRATERTAELVAQHEESQAAERAALAEAEAEAKGRADAEAAALAAVAAADVAKNAEERAAVTHSAIENGGLFGDCPEICRKPRPPPTPGPRVRG